MKAHLTGPLLLVFLSLASFAAAAPAPLVEGRFSPGIWKVISDNDLNPNQDVTKFGSVDLLTSNDRRYRLSNAGSGILYWEGASSSDGQFEILTTGGNPQGFNPPGIPILGGQSREFIIRFIPNALDEQDTTITLETNLTSINAEYTFAVEGIGVSPEIRMSGKSSLSAGYDTIVDGETTVRVSEGTEFGNFPLAGGFSAHYFKITNEGNRNLDISNALFTGPGASDFKIHGLSTLTDIAPNNSREFEIRFDPESAGLKTAQFWIETNDPIVDLFFFNLRGVATTFPEIEFKGRRSGGTGQTFSNIADGDSSPDAGNGTEFWTTAVGSSSDSRFRIYNTGNAPLSLSTPTLGGANPGQFSILPLSTSNLPAGQNREFVIRFSPTSAGIKTATFSIANGDNTESPFNFTIRGGSFVTPVPEIRLSGKSNVSGDYIDIENGETVVSVAQGTDFGNFPLSGGFSTNFFQITNDGNERLTVGDIYLTGLGAPQFAIHDQTGNAAGPGDVILFEIRFNPGSPGIHQAEVRIDNDDPDEARFTFAVAGTATTFSEIQVEGRRTGGVGQTLSEVEDDSVAVFSSNGTKFPTTNWGESSDSLFRITNTSSDTPLTLEMPEIIGPDADQFTILPFLTDDIPPRGFRDLFIRFAPNSRGTKTATFSIGNNDNNENPFDFAIAGTATGGPELKACGRTGGLLFTIAAGDLNPNQTVTNHGNVGVGEDGRRTYCLKNTGTADFIVESVTSSNPNFVLVFPNSSFPLSGEEWPDFVLGGVVDDLIPNIYWIDFIPTSSGEETSVITIISNDPENPTYTFAVKATGIAPDMTVSGGAPNYLVEIPDNDDTPEAADGTALGEAAVNGQTRVSLFRIRNEGNRPLRLNGANINLQSDHPDDFSVILPFVGDQTIQPGNHLDFFVEFDPTAPGLRTARVGVFGDDPFEGHHYFTVSGVGVTTSDPPAIEIKGDGSLGPAVIPNGDETPSRSEGTYFGSRSVGGSVASRTFTICNTSRADLEISAIYADHPSYDVPLTNLTIPPLGSRQFTVTFDPTSGGVADAIITVLNDDPNNASYTFAVTANVSGDPTPPSIGDISIDGDDGEITVDGAPGVSYRLVKSTTLEPGSWSVLPGYGNILGTGTPQILSLIDLVDPELEPTLFFRLEEN